MGTTGGGSLSEAGAAAVPSPTTSVKQKGTTKQQQRFRAAHASFRLRMLHEQNAPAQKQIEPVCLPSIPPWQIDSSRLCALGKQADLGLGAGAFNLQSLLMYYSTFLWHFSLALFFFRFFSAYLCGH